MFTKKIRKEQKNDDKENIKNRGPNLPYLLYKV